MRIKTLLNKVERVKSFVGNCGEQVNCPEL